MVRKSKERIEAATEDYIEGILELFPGSVVEIAPKAFDGFDVLLIVRAPSDILESDDMAELRMSKADLSIRISEKTGVNITSMLEEMTRVATNASDGKGKKE